MATRKLFATSCYFCFTVFVLEVDRNWFTEGAGAGRIISILGLFAF